MKVKHAIFEKRNLGVDSYEITVEPSDSFEALRDKIEALPPTDYLVVKTPTANQELLWGLPTLGFSFIEAMLLLQMRPEQLVYLSQFDALKESVQFEVADTEAKRQLIYDNVKSGLFSGDRISLDKRFTTEDANRRYANWTRDAYEIGANLIQMLYDGTPAGYFVNWPLFENGEGSMGLTALYGEMAGKKLGSYMIYHEAKLLFDTGATLIHTGVSSNNYRSVKPHLALGFEIERIDYIYAKHMTEDTK